ncbi:hypothetical protein [Blastopirellula marina]|uniref:Uncharacterized protein n=1 Tax=Blastopirellula marina TaxID=124 RepID=A0A2S8F6P4_9BACT|nr:hypothetical protein [Blastopirellula marina]PQO27831.1 hypothetical protein C5Y98_26235 [Blastopirellula marina]PTL41566.1 hypothetical protein C5Y97_26250 [Blastopirellula marina]
MEFEPDEWEATIDYPRPSWVHVGLSVLVIVASLTLFAVLISLFFHPDLAMALLPFPFLLAVVMLGWTQYRATFLHSRKSAEVAMWLCGGLGAISGLMLFMSLPHILTILVVEPRQAIRIVPGVIFCLLTLSSSISNYHWWETLKRYPVEEFKVPRRFRISLKEMLLAFTALTYVIGIVSLMFRSGLFQRTF